MKSLEHPALSDKNLTGTTVVYREVYGGPEYVVVCGDCERIQVIGLPDAMQAALGVFMEKHRATRHAAPGVTVPLGNSSAPIVPSERSEDAID